MKKHPKYVLYIAAVILCLGFTSLSFGSEMKLNFTSDYKEDPVGFNSNSDSDTIIKAPGSTCCVNNGWQTEDVADGLYLVNGAVAPVPITDLNPTGYKAILATDFDVKAGETYTFEATGKSMKYTYAAKNSLPVFSWLFGKVVNGTMVWWESNHFTATEDTYTTLASIYQAAVDGHLYMLLVDTNNMFETNDGIAGIKAHGPPDTQNVPTPEPASILLVACAVAYLVQRKLRQHQLRTGTTPVAPF